MGSENQPSSMYSNKARSGKTKQRRGWDGETTSISDNYVLEEVGVRHGGSKSREIIFDEIRK